MATEKAEWCQKDDYEYRGRPLRDDEVIEIRPHKHIDKFTVEFEDGIRIGRTHIPDEKS